MGEAKRRAEARARAEYGPQIKDISIEGIGFRMVVMRHEELQKHVGWMKKTTEGQRFHFALNQWTLAILNGHKQPCLCCEYEFDRERDEPPGAFVCIAPATSDAGIGLGRGICKGCAERYSQEAMEQNAYEAGATLGLGGKLNRSEVKGGSA